MANACQDALVSSELPIEEVRSEQFVFDIASSVPLFLSLSHRSPFCRSVWPSAWQFMPRLRFCAHARRKCGLHALERWRAFATFPICIFSPMRQQPTAPRAQKRVPARARLQFHTYFIPWRVHSRTHTLKRRSMEKEEDTATVQHRAHSASARVQYKLYGKARAHTGQVTS